jgi:hypothetical protein
VKSLKAPENFALGAANTDSHLFLARQEGNTPITPQ